MITREQARKRFEELPLPSTSDEHWRFTDLRGLPDSPARSITRQRSAIGCATSEPDSHSSSFRSSMSSMSLSRIGRATASSPASTMM